MSVSLLGNKASPTSPWGILIEREKVEGEKWMELRERDLELGHKLLLNMVAEREFNHREFLGKWCLASHGDLPPP